jgi:hypothetical protein
MDFNNNISNLQDIKVVNFNDNYNELLKIIKQSKDKKEIAKCCQLYSRLFSTENKLKKNINDIDKFINKLNEKSIDPNHTETSDDYNENILKFD